MLVLNRKEGQSIELSGGIRVMVVSIVGRRVRIGIDAPNSIGILRTELVLEDEKEDADGSDPNGT
jgi:carbon storage regulator